jgi:hypothetical protein
MRFALVVLVVSCALTAYAQQSAEKPTIIVGIATPASQSRALFNDIWERDQMVRDINSQSASDKKAAAKIEAVALDGSTMDEVASQLRDKNCQFVVLTVASEQIGVVGYDSAAGVPDPMRPPPDTSGGAAKVLGVKYSISRVAQPGVFSHGAILAQGTGDGFGQSAINTAFRDTATRIRNEIKKQKPQPVY